MRGGETSTKIDGAIPARVLQPQTLEPELFAAMLRGVTVLTLHQRVARTLRAGFDWAMRRRPNAPARWTPPTVLALDSWMPSLWHRLMLNGDESRMLLNRTQEHSVWRSIIGADREVSGLRSLDSLASLAARSWALLCLHNGRGRLREFASGTDSRAFARWAAEFERRASNGGFVAAAQLPASLESALAEGTLPLPAEGLALVDCDALRPAHASLFEAIRRAGYDLLEFKTGTAAQRSVHVAADDEEELRAAAGWLAERVAMSPGARFALVVPEIAERQLELERVLGEALAPEAQPITAAAAPPMYEFSLGQPLAHTDLCATALDLLGWLGHPLPVPAIGRLLLSPYLGGNGPEALAAADFDVYTLRTHPLLRPELSLDALLDLLRGSRQAARLPDLLRRLQAFRRAATEEHLDGRPDRQTHGAWSDGFRTVLEAAGWLRLAQQSAAGAEALRRWESALDELATLDFDPTPVTAEDALAQLGRITRETIFAPASRDAPVQVVGPLELGGIPFDGLWFLGAHDLAWPPAMTPQPLIPWAVQRSLGMASADPARAYADALALTRRVAGQAAEVVFSYAEAGEEGVRRPSPLLGELTLSPSGYRPQLAPSIPIALESFADALPIAPLPDAPVRGGAQVLQLQAACGFRAFAEKRLLSVEPETREAGSDSRERGSDVHKVMHAFWSTVRDQPGLKALTGPQREAILGQSIEAALAPTVERARSAWERAYVDVQRRRLAQLLRPWLDFEHERPVFAVRAQEEATVDAQIGPLRLELRVDRVDETEAGPLILDYKTGSAKPSDWLGERPDAPQLPLYAVLAAEPPAGVAFALLRAGDGLDLKGFALDKTVLAKPSKASLPIDEQIEEWRRVLTALAEAFAAGDAAVAPKSYPKTCQTCAQRILCRLDVAGLEEADEEDAEPAEVAFG